MGEVVFKDGKRVSARGVIIYRDSVYLMFRRKKKKDGSFKEYFVVPGGGIEAGEDEITALKREMEEELCIDVKVLDKIGVDEKDETIANYYSLKILDGKPTLGGEEKEKSCEDNYYEIKLIKIKDLDDLDVDGKEFILEAYNKKHKKD